MSPKAQNLESFWIAEQMGVPGSEMHPPPTKALVLKAWSPKQQCSKVESHDYIMRAVISSMDKSIDEFIA
jgi:hypothetical protein